MKLKIFISVLCALPLLAPAAVIDRAYMTEVAMRLTGMSVLPNGKFITERGSDKGRALTRQYLSQEYLNLGYHVSLESFSKGQNVIAQKASTTGNPFYILSAHLDSEKNAGANDDASGLAIMLAVARALKETDTRGHIKFISFDREEDGRVGSKYHVKNTDQSDLLGVIHMDMIGFTLQTLPPYRVYLDICSASANRALAQMFMLAASNHDLHLQGIAVCRGSSDHESFWKMQLPALRLTSSKEAKDDPCYHQSCDHFSRLNLTYMHEIASALYHALKDN